MIQEISGNFDKTFKNRIPEENDIVFSFMNGMVLCNTDDNRVSFPVYQTIEKRGKYLFSIDEKRYFLWCDEPVNIEGYTYQSIRSCYKLNDPQDACFALVSAYHVYCWYRDNQYCGRCGSKTAFDSKEFALRCSCGNIIYPRINPAVNIGIINGNKLLMAKHIGRSGNPYALISGFCEYGESLEDTVKRETMEEVHLRIKNIRYAGSQPWGIAGNLQVGYFCDLDGDDTIIRQEDELMDARWFERADIPEDVADTSITGWMIRKFKYQK